MRGKKKNLCKGKQWTKIRNGKWKTWEFPRGRILMTAILYTSHNLCNHLLFSCFCTPYSSSVPSTFLSSEACALHQTFVCLVHPFIIFSFLYSLCLVSFFLWAPKEAKHSALHGQIKKNNVLFSFLNVLSFVLCSFSSLLL